jgi:hypothetical protein
MIGASQTLFVALMICGSLLIVTGSLGVSAAYSKNECLAFIVSI